MNQTIIQNSAKKYHIIHRRHNSSGFLNSAFGDHKQQPNSANKSVLNSSTFLSTSSKKKLEINKLVDQNSFGIQSILDFNRRAHNRYLSFANNQSNHSVGEFK
jgi:hypothetical protein